jgi:hypothetical protein
MARLSGGRSSGPNPLLGLGVGAVSVNTCSTSDNSFFCQFSRIFQMIMWTFTLLVIAFVVVSFLSVFLFSKRRGSKGFF